MKSKQKTLKNKLKNNKPSINKKLKTYKTIEKNQQNNKENYFNKNLKLNKLKAKTSYKNTRL